MIENVIDGTVINDEYSKSPIQDGPDNDAKEAPEEQSPDGLSDDHAPKKAHVKLLVACAAVFLAIVIGVAALFSHHGNLISRNNVIEAHSTKLFTYYVELFKRAIIVETRNGKPVTELEQAAAVAEIELTFSSSNEELRAAMNNDALWLVSDIELDVWNQSANATIEPTPTATVDAFISAVKNQDATLCSLVYEAGEYDLTYMPWVGGEADDETHAMRDELLYPKMLDFDYTIDSETVEGDTASVTVTITTYRIGDAFNTAITNYASQGMLLALGGASGEELDALLNNQMRNAFSSMTTKDYTQTVVLTLHREDDGWIVDTVDRSSDFTNAATGGLRQTVDMLDEVY